MVLRFLIKNITIKSAKMLSYHSNNRNNNIILTKDWKIGEIKIVEVQIQCCEGTKSTVKGRNHTRNVRGLKFNVTRFRSSRPATSSWPAGR